MNKTVKAKWVKALRSGDYQQGKGQLRKGNKFCCLGVLCNLHAMQHPEIAAVQKLADSYMNSTAFLPLTVGKWAGIDNSGFLKDLRLSLVELNDKGLGFKEIASIIEESF